MIVTSLIPHYAPVKCVPAVMGWLLVQVRQLRLSFGDDHHLLALYKAEGSYLLKVLQHRLRGGRGNRSG